MFSYTYDKSGNRLQAVEQMGAGEGAEAPETPANFNPSAEGYAAIALQWDDQADDESGYYLDRSTDNQTTWQRIAELEGDSASYLDSGLLLHVPYGYRLTAWNEAGASTPLTLQAETSFKDTGVIEEPGEVTLNPTGAVTITYSYDPLDRLTLADYSTGIFYGYSYDSVGNRLTEDLLLVDSTYTYDEANRLVEVNGIPYTWDANGNLLVDGTYTYTYDHANRLVEVNGDGVATSYTYNGLGDRLRQVVDGQTTDFTLYINAGLTQVLSDGENTYLYGLSRLAQQTLSGWEFYLTDALGSVRQLADYSGVTLTRSYEPFGMVGSSAGSGISSYGYTGEWTESQAGLVYLRARYYSSTDGRFISKDQWDGNHLIPLTLNKWEYVEGNPINRKDPSGRISEKEEPDAEKILQEIENTYGVKVVKDWGWKNVSDPTSIDLNQCGNKYWVQGNWKSLKELQWIKKGIETLAIGLGGSDKINSALGRNLVIVRNSWWSGSSFAPPGLNKYFFGGDIVLANDVGFSEKFAIGTVIHEFGHVWDYKNNNRLSWELAETLGTGYCNTYGECYWDPYTQTPGGDYIEPEIPPGTPLKCHQPGDPFSPNCVSYASTLGQAPFFTQPGAEDWAMSIVGYIYPEAYKNEYTGLTPNGVRENYVRGKINAIP